MAGILKVVPQAERKRALGRGLGALIAEARHAPVEVEAGAGTTLLAIDDIKADSHQPRRDFDDDALDELAQSLKHQGVLQPVLVRKDGKHYRLIAGERRWRAAARAGLKEIPALVREATETEAFELALVENLQRQDLSPLEEAEGYRRLMEERRWTQEQVASRVGKERSSVANALRLLGLPDEVKRLLAEGALDMGHCRALLGVTKPSEMVVLAKAAVKEKWSVREIEAQVKDARPLAKAGKKSAPRTSPEARRLIEDLQRKLGTRVHLKEKGAGKGVLGIEFFSYEDLDRIVALIRR
ncbi:MAG: ParB/RepB/Spo0J family partition protein [Myxococcaceae bacterium]|nr:ParB/RepB/Spo0J family partition protein [Myxococcaceae bacterium]